MTSTSEYSIYFPWHIFKPQPWMRHAACRGLDTNIFFPDRGDDYRPAKRICNECPVREQCLEYSFEIPQVIGIWGGITGKERRKEKARRNTTPTKTVIPIKHGTNSGYVVHRKRRETACDPCKEARRVYRANIKNRNPKPNTKP